ncbi:hypothetical protein OQL15_000976 [Clostridium perfringens]|nr:hypothetical protein [Clostridium perfringens]
MVSTLEVNKYKAKSIASAVINSLQGIEVDDIISELFIKGEDEEAETLIKMFEKQLVYSKINEPVFKGNLYRFFKKTALYIVKNNLVKEFFRFAYKMYINLESKEIKKGIVNAYLSLLMEQSSYLESQFKTICGITEDGTVIECDEIYKKLEYPIIEIMNDKNKPKNSRGIFSLLQKKYKVLGYDINNEQEYHIYIANQQLITNMLFHMTYLIDENCIEIVSEPYYLPCIGFDGDIRVVNDTEYYKKSLRIRKYMLPQNGLICEVQDIESIKEILFMEKFLDNGVVMLYRLKMNNGRYTSGFYDINNEFFFSVWRGSLEGEICHKMIENFVLEAYLRVTTNRIDNEEDLGYYNNFNFYYKYDDELSQVSKKKYRKGEYFKEITKIKPYIRKLPQGAKASDEARELALKYGYLLEDGETFVNEFKKNLIKRKLY